MNFRLFVFDRLNQDFRLRLCVNERKKKPKGTGERVAESIERAWSDRLREEKKRQVEMKANEKKREKEE